MRFAYLILLQDTPGQPSHPQTRGNPFTSDANTLLLIHSDYTGGLGADSSGNYNNFAATNLVATDQMIDTPTNNFCTMNPLVTPNHEMTYVIEFTEGNLKVGTNSASHWQGYVGTIGSIIRKMVLGE